MWDEAIGKLTIMSLAEVAASGERVPPTRWTSRVSLLQKCEVYVTRFAPHKALDLIA